MELKHYIYLAINIATIIVLCKTKKHIDALDEGRNDDE